VLFNLPGHRVVEAVDLPDGRRRVVVEAIAEEDGCPDCGVVSKRVHSHSRQRLRDVPLPGSKQDPVELFVVKRRFACTERACPRWTFVHVNGEVPLRARVTTRLREAVLEAVVAGGRAVSAVAGGHGLGWWTVMSQVVFTGLMLTDPDILHAGTVRRLGIDEHRYRSVRFYRQPVRRDAAVLGAPPIPGLAADPDQPARLHRAHPGDQQLPVPGLHLQLTLPATTTHRHTP
jgi:hypothetical protein